MMPDAALAREKRGRPGAGADNALARRFRDEAGRLNQLVAAATRRVVLLTRLPAAAAKGAQT